METVTVSIYGESYTLRSNGDPESAREAARFVDGKMREIASGGKVIPTSKIAILAALNIADELLRQIRASDSERAETDRRIERLLSDLHRALEE